MKIRLFSDMVNGVYRLTVLTEDWSQGDLELMFQYGEPEVNLGGEISYTYNDAGKTKLLGDQLVRLFHGFPYAIGFDSRDYAGGSDEAVAVGNAWKQKTITAIGEAVTGLRQKAPISTEEVVNEGV